MTSRILAVLLWCSVTAFAQAPADAKAQPTQAEKPNQAKPAEKPASYPLTPEQTNEILQLALAEQRTASEFAAAEQQLRAAHLETRDVQGLLGAWRNEGRAKQDAKQVLALTAVLLATGNWQDADQATQAARRNTLAWLNQHRPPDCPECQLSQDFKSWLRR
jgi:hypothetical protein